MTDQELRKLNRLELLELLTKQQERIEELENRVDELEERLQDRQIRIAEAGSIAEAALELTGIFEKAQEAADLYLANVRKGSVKQSTPVPSRRPVQKPALNSSQARPQGKGTANPAEEDDDAWLDWID